LGKGIHDRVPRVRAACAEALGKLQPDDQVIIRELISVADDGDAVVRRACCAALGQVQGSPEYVIPALTKLVTDENGEVQIAALQALSHHRRVAGPVIPTVINVLEATTRSGVKYQAAKTLGKVGKQAAVGLGALRACLTHEDERVRDVAAFAIGRMGEAGRDAIADLIRLKNDDPSVDVQRAAEDALNAIRSEIADD
jgi:HEAT repeat protein